MTLLYLVAAWAAGIFFAPRESPTGVWLALAAGSFVLAYVVRRRRSHRLGLLCAALFMLGAGRYAWATRPLPANHIQHYTDSGYVTLTGLIAQDADVRDKHVNLHIEVESLQDGDTYNPAQGRILIQAPRYGEYSYGDRVRVSGQLLTPPEFDDFSYRDYLARRGIHAMIPNAQVDILEHDQGQPWYAAMYKLKERAQQTIDRLLPSPQAPLLSGILLGVESSISDDVREAFNRTGTSHVIAISGANIIVVIGVLMKLLEPGLGKRRAGWVTMIGVGVYTLFVGADPAVVRAAIMGGLAVMASQLGRKTYGLTSLAFAIWLMTAWNPLTLWDVGFQLSIAATAGLILFGDIFTRWLEKLLRLVFAQDTARKVTQWLSEPIAVSLAAQITTTPLILVYFGRLSAISLLANILIVPVQSYIMTVGWLAVLVGMIWSTLGELLAWVVWIPLTYTIEVVRALSKVEWASVNVDFSSSYAWGFYSALLVLALMMIQHPEDRADLFRLLRQRITAYTVIIVGVIVAILVWLMAWQQPDGKLHVWFLDVGHGHAVLIQTPNGAQILIDGGPNPTQLRSAVGDQMPFWDRDLDLLIVTQPKTTAISAIPALLDRYDVQLALTNGHVADSDSYQALVQAWKKHNIEVLPVTAGYRLETGDHVLLEILHPQTSPNTDAKIEDEGMIIRVSYGDTAFLITPDLSTKAEDALSKAGWYVGSTVLELPSHGDDDANPAAFLRAVSPQAAVVIVGAGNRSNLPSDQTLQRLEDIKTVPVYRTDQHGTVEMVTDGQTLWIY
ncbi:MAG: ComEC/Rec2 family competence protein [Anaerolineae bacterium]|nr:ComEC/Rec2 family competence protein [Anaerolineae bacterium]